MNPKAAVALLLVVFAFFVIVALTWPRYEVPNARAKQWLREHPDIVARARLAVHASPTQTP